MADFLFRALAQRFTFYRYSALNSKSYRKKECAVCAVGYKKCDLKTIEVVARKQSKDRGF